MTKKLLFVTTILLALAFVASAADIDGKWVYDQPGRGGGNPTKATLTLKAEGAKLTGNLSRAGRDGAMMESPITEGKVEGNTVSFKVSRQGGGGTITSDYVGKLEGGDLKLTITQPGRDGNQQKIDAVAKKSTT